MQAFLTSTFPNYKPFSELLHGSKTMEYHALQSNIRPTDIKYSLQEPNTKCYKNIHSCFVILVI